MIFLSRLGTEDIKKSFQQKLLQKDHNTPPNALLWTLPVQGSFLLWRKTSYTLKE